MIDFLPAYDQERSKPVLILKFIKSTVYKSSNPASYGQRFETVMKAVVSTEDGLISTVDVDDLVIMWALIRIRDGKSRMPSHKAIERAYNS